MQVLDLYGNVAIEKNLSDRRGNRQVDIDLSSLTSAVYIIRLTADNWSSNFRIVKQ